MSERLPKMARHAVLAQIFSPGAPVAKRDQFAGRLDQVFAVIGGWSQAGMHVVMYGERGVGKTSLANVIAEFLEPIQGMVNVARVNCATSDTFASVWQRVYKSLGLEHPDWKYDPPAPDQIRQALAGLETEAMIIIDEYDRLEDEDGLSLMADTLKSLSDHAVKSKVVIVGVADSVEALVGEHESIQRALVEVQMPRMSEKELNEIIDGLGRVDMTIEVNARRMVARLAEGLPFFVHKLMLSASQTANREDRDEVVLSDVRAAISEAVGIHALLKDYETAIRSPRPGNLYARVLTACALAKKDALGFFSANAVRDPMSQIMEKRYDIPAFARHLNAFLEEDRGRVLQRTGSTRNFAYRFRNPLLQPYTLLTAVNEGILDKEFLNLWFDGDES